MDRDQELKEFSQEAPMKFGVFFFICLHIVYLMWYLVWIAGFSEKKRKSFGIISKRVDLTFVKKNLIETVPVHLLRSFVCMTSK